MTNTYPTKNKKQKEQTKNTGKWKDDQYVPHKKKTERTHKTHRKLKRWPIRTPQKIRNRKNTQKTQEN